ncbi:XdhC family protein [Bacillus sp. PS06]|uniref:XdhC family protein n=1 Tax=Bacillus sp. PS06 TaxID=2764176 RepID=UPI00177C4926|nr:XdhC/CoxI family protein [Bacillus sp. PS06]MBD8068006.1 XdhC family protein [Bacillus sp. PS06]
MKYTYSVLEHLASRDSKYLATIINVEGSSYQKEGTSMVFNKDGSSTGLLSGGCLEADLYERIKLQDPSFTSFSTLYDMSSEDDLSWGQGVGCNGTIQVLVERLTDQLKRHFITLSAKLNEGFEVTLIKKLTANYQLVGYRFVCEDGTSFGTLNEITNSESSSLTKEFPFVYFKASQCYYFSQLFSPPPKLLVFGAGPDAIPLVELTSGAGFKVVVCDWRPGFCNEDYFPKAHQLVIGNTKELICQTKPNNHDFVVIMTHHFQKDKELIHQLLPMKVRYLGLLGSLARSQRLLEGVQPPKWVHYPIGLSIQAKDPHEIAISILAELIQVKNRSTKTELMNI